MNLTSEDWKMIGAAVIAGLFFWAWAIMADRQAQQEFDNRKEAGE